MLIGQPEVLADGACWRQIIMHIIDQDCFPCVQVKTGFRQEQMYYPPQQGMQQNRHHAMRGAAALNGNTCGET